MNVRTIKLLLVCSLAFGLSACLLESSDNDTNRVVSRVIPVTGGTINSGDDDLQLDFPDGALASDTEIEIRKLSTGEVAEKYPDLDPAPQVYELSPDGIRFLQPVDFTFEIDDLQPGTLVIAASVNDQTADPLLNILVDPQSGSVSGQIEHFSDFLVQRIEAEFTVPDATFEVGFLQIYEYGLEYQEPTDNLPVLLNEYVFATGSPLETGSGTSQIIAINEQASSDLDSLNEVDLSGSVALQCVTPGEDRVIIPVEYQSVGSVSDLLLPVTGTTRLSATITCVDSSTGSDPISKAELAIVQLGNLAEGVRLFSNPPYEDSIGSGNKQRFIAASSVGVTVFDSSGEILVQVEEANNDYGVLGLVDESGNPYWMRYGPNGTTLCPFDEGFCKIDPPGARNTTDAKMGRDASGAPLDTEAFFVQNGAVGKFTADGNGFLEEEVFDGRAGQFSETQFGLFSYEPLTDTTGLGASEDGHVWFVDTDADSYEYVTGSAGSGIRDIACDRIPDQGYVCGVLSYEEAKLTPCAGTASGNFTCSEQIDFAASVSLGAATTDDGKLGVVATDYNDGSVHLAEIAFDLANTVPVFWHYSDLIALSPLVGIGYLNAGHTELDPVSDAIVISGNGSGNAMIVPLDETGELLGTTFDTTEWFN